MNHSTESNSTSNITSTHTANTKAHYSDAESFGSLILVVFIAACAGIALGSLQGFTFPKVWKFPGYRLKPVLKVVVIPPLVIMIIFGCIVENWLPASMTAPYPTYFTKFIRGFCLCILLIRGGLQVSFTGKGLVVLFLSTLPQLCEACVVAAIGKQLFDMPTEVAFSLGFSLACISPSIVVPGLMSLNDRGYGKKKNIAGILIASGTFDDIICIIVFSTCKTISVFNAGFSGSGSSLGWEIGKLFIENAVSLCIGVVLGLFGWVLKFIKDK